MIIPAPEMRSWTVPMANLLKIAWIAIGRTAIDAKNVPPKRFNLFETLPMYSAVSRPGRMPGI